MCSFTLRLVGVKSFLAMIVILILIVILFVILIVILFVIVIVILVHTGCMNELQLTPEELPAASLQLR